MDFSDELKQFAEHFRDVDSAIREYFRQMLDGDFHNRPDLVNSRIEDIQALLNQRLLENELSVTLTMLAAIESWFKIDCDSRAKKREKSPLGRELKKVYTKYAKYKPGKKISFDEILDAWSSAEPKSKQIIGHIRGAFKYRHWLAHGRYWEPKLGRKYDYSIVSVIADDAVALLKAPPQTPGDL